ncbi:MAG: CmpX protein [Parcubacteria group bacterium LiPW_15]|nr:MAG: CmpX protein [Parcubacteria group bacterium LiPW_15]
MTQSWLDILGGSLGNLWLGVTGFLPNFILAIVVFIIGLIVASLVATVIEKLFESVKLDALLHKLGLSPYFERAGMQLKSARFLGRLFYWFIVIAFLLAVSDSLKLFALSAFLRDVLYYIPNVIVAVLILLAAFVVGNFAKKLVIASVMGAKLHSAKFLGSLVWWAIVVFGFVTALSQLGIATAIIQALITGFIAMLAIAGGLAFGLGGRDYAAHLIGKFKETTESR